MGASVRPVTLGQIAYEAYVEHFNSKSVCAEDWPIWRDLGFQAQGHWEAVAGAVVESALGWCPPPLGHSCRLCDKATSHSHSRAELDAPAWDLDRLHAHLTSMHGMTLAGFDLHELAAIHAAEHPTQWATAT